MLKLRTKGLFPHDAQGWAAHRWFERVLKILTADELVEWRSVAAQLLEASRQRGEKLTVSSEHSGVEDVGCEACLMLKRCIVLWSPERGMGVLSGHANGDWLCGDCDPRAEAVLLLHALSNLVNA